MLALAVLRLQLTELKLACCCLNSTRRKDDQFLCAVLSSAHVDSFFKTHICTAVNRQYKSDEVTQQNIGEKVFVGFILIRPSAVI